MDRLAHEGVETSDVAVDAAPAEVRGRPGGRLADELKRRVAIERPEQLVDVHQAGRRAVGQLASRLLLRAQSFDLRSVTLGRGDQPLAPAVEQDDRVVEMVEQGRRRVATEVGEEQVEPLFVDTRLEQLAVALPLLAHVIAQGGRVEG